MPDETIDWSQFKPTADAPARAAGPAVREAAPAVAGAAARDVDWSQFTPVAGAAPVPTSANIADAAAPPSLEEQLKATYGLADTAEKRVLTGAKDAAGDLAVTTGKVFTGAGKALYGLADMGTRAVTPPWSPSLDEGLRTVGAAPDFARTNAALEDTFASDRYKASQKALDVAGKSTVPETAPTSERIKGELDALWGSIKQLGSDPYMLTMKVLENLPQSLALVSVGEKAVLAAAAPIARMAAAEAATAGLVGKEATAFVSGKVSEYLATKGADRLARAASAATETLQSMGDAAQGRTEEMQKFMAEGKLKLDPLTYNMLQREADIRGLAMAPMALVSYGLGGIESKLARQGAAKASGGALKGALSRPAAGVKGGLQEAGEEFFQAGPETAGSNFASQAYNPSQNLIEGMGGAAGQGALIGAASGGGLGLIKGGGRKPAAAPPGTPSPGAGPIPASEVLGTPDGQPAAAPPAGTAPPPAAPPTATMQPRDRERPASILQMEKIANKPDYDQASIAPTPTDGAPMVAIKGDTEAPALTGREATITFANGMKVPVNYSVVEADSVLASHDIAGKENPAYLQPQPGAAIALNNGRVIGIAEAYNRGTAAEYKARLVADAPSLGLNPDAVAAMAKPMLVRVYSDEFNKIPNIGQLSNGGGGMRMGASEQARVDAANIRDLSGLVLNDAGVVNVNASRAFLMKFVDAAGGNDQNTLIGTDKQPTPALLNRVRHAIFAKAYGGGPILERVAESTDDNIRRISNGMLIAAPAVASLRQAMDAGRVDKSIDLIPHFVQAMEQLSVMREKGDNVDEFLAQSDIIGSPFSPETLEILSKVNEISRSSKAVAIFLKTYAEAARAAGEIAQGGLLATPIPTKGELITHTKERSNEETGSAIAAVEKDIQDEKIKRETAARHGSTTRQQPEDAQPGTGERAQDVADDGDPQPAAQVDDTGKNIPERPEDLEAQQGELVAGRRGAVMFPKGTPELAPPDGMARLETPRGIFHFNPRKLTAAQITAKSAAGRENELLGFGPYSKADVLARAAPGEVPFYLVERGAGGEELRGALAVRATEAETRAAFEASKNPKSTIVKEDLAGMLERRQGIPPANDPELKNLKAPQAKILRGLYLDAAREKPGFDARITAIADTVAGKPLLGKLKGVKRAVEKINADYLGDASRIKDILRSTVIVDTLAQAEAAIKLISEQFTFEGSKQRNLLDSTDSIETADGYRDAKFNVNINGHVAEIQVNLAKMMVAKDAVHHLYAEREKIERTIFLEKRDKTAREAARIDELNAQMRAVYLPAWRASLTSATNSVADTGAPLRRAEDGSKDDGGSVSQRAEYKPTPGTVPSETGVPSTSSSATSGGKVEGTSIAPSIPENDPDSKGYGANNTLVSRAAYEAAQQAFRGTQLNAGLDPVQAKAALTMAVFHIEAGARTFAQFTDAMVKALGTKIRPHLKQLYDAVSDRGLFGGLDTAPIVVATDAKINRVIPKVPVKKTTAAAIAAVQEDLFAGLENQAQTAQNEGTKGASNEPTPRNDSSKTPRPGAEAGGQPAAAGEPGRVPGQPGSGNAGVDSGADGTGAVGPGRPGSSTSSEQRPALGNGDSTPRDRLPERIRRGDYRFSVDDLSEKGSAYQRTLRNVEAVELLKRLEAEGKQATPEQQTILAKFQGWGSSEIRNQLFPKNRWDRKDNWQVLHDRLSAVMSEEELNAANRSTQYAHYTSRAVVNSIFRGLARMGFNGGQILEPGMGIGNFPGLMPEDMWTHSAYTGIEFDPITGGIAKQLFPDEHIRVESFVDTKLPQGFYDIAFGNPPFAPTIVRGDPQYKKNGFALHDFFFAKSVDLLKPGGILAFVTSHYTMDKAGDKARAYLSERADLLGAIRLPQTAFKKNAGTEVVTDVIFLRKRAEGEPAAGESWAGLKEVATPEGPAWVNEYFAAHPEMVLGTHSRKGSMYGKNEYTVLPPEVDIETAFAAAIENLPVNVYRPAPGSKAAQTQAIAIDMNPKAEKEGNYYLSDKGVLMVRSAGVGMPAVLGKGGLNSKQAEIVRNFVPLRDSLKAALYDQLNNGDWEASLKKLQSAYRKFVGVHGKINQFTTIDRISKKTGEPKTSFRFPIIEAFADDPDALVVSSLETFNEETREISEGHFLKDRVLQKPQEPEINTPQDALMVTLNERGKVDLPAVAARIGMSEEAVIDALGDAIYETPSGTWQMADEYLSGAVVDKLDEARIAARADPRFERNVKALEKSQPQLVPPSDIGVQLGANWVDPAYVQQFAREIARVGTRIQYIDVTNTWVVDPVSGYATTTATQDWGTPRRPFHALLEAALNKRQVQVMTPRDREGKTHVDTAATTAANEKLVKIKGEFSAWVWQDTERATKLSQIYNEKFNRIQPRQFDGKHLTMPGLTLTFKPHDHVKRAVWRVIQTGNTYLAHAVGAGKTAEMIISAMEQKRLGLIKKPMFAVPNHMLKQFASEFQELYPAAKIMIADEKNFVGDRRREFVARATLSDIDGLVITHSAMKKLDVDPKFKGAMIEEFLDDLRAALEDTDRNDRVRRRNIEAQIEKVEQKLAAAMASTGKDASLRFDQMGVDMLYVDEAHKFRKLDFATQMGNVKGLDPNGSDRAFDLYVKARWLEEKNPGRSIVMASGTPITNTMAELYTVQRFMNEKALAKLGLAHFDAWASMFGTEKTMIESDAAGRYGAVTRFTKFLNVPELGQMFRQFADVLTSQQLGSLLSTRPKVEGGGRQLVIAEPSPDLKEYQAELADRMKAIEARKGPPEKGDDILLSVITDGRLASIDMRYVRPWLPSDPTSKLNVMIDNIIAEYKATADLQYTGANGKTDLNRGAAQMVFSDLGFGEGVTKRGFDARAWVITRLTEAGIPRSEVAFMSDHKKSDDKLKLFVAVKTGKVRVLIGSSENMGTGVNVQKRLIAMQHLDSPWFPADLEQREGRIVRQKNQNPLVRIKAFATKGTYDTVMWQMLATKQSFIDQVLQGNRDIRSVDDVTDVDQYTMATAMTAGDERAILLAGLKSDIAKYERLQQAFHDQQVGMASKLGWARSRLPGMEESLPVLTKQAARVQDLAGDKFTITIGGKPFTERKAAGQALLEEFTTRTKKFQDGVTKIGEFSGFDLEFHGKITQEAKGVTYKSAIFYMVDTPVELVTESGTDPVGRMMALQGTLAHLRKLPAQVAAEIESTKTEIADLSSRVGAKFEFAEILVDKKREARALEQELTRASEAPQVAAAYTDEANDGTPPKVGEDFIVYRAATAEGLAGRNAGNANSVAAHLLRQDDQESPGTGGAAATQIFVYKVKITAPFGKYETITRHTTDRQPAPGKAVGRGTDNAGNINYSFETGGAWDGKLIGTLDLKTIRDQIEEATGGRTFDDAGTQLGAQIIRGEAEAKVFADQLVSAAIGPMPLAGAPLRRRIGGKGLPRAQVAAIVKDVAAKSKFPIEIRDGAPSAFHASIADDAPGAYWNGRVYIFPQNITSVNDLYRVLAHELVGHASVIEMLGDAYPQIVKEIQNAKSLRNPAVLRLAQHVRETHGKLDAYTESSEILARAAEEAVDAEGNIRPGFAWFKRTLSVVAQWLRSKGISVSFTNAELAGLVSRAAVRLNQAAPGRPLGTAVPAQSGKTLAAGAARPASPKTRTSLLDLISRKAGGEAIAKYITQPLWERAVTLGARVLPNAVKVGIGGYSLPEPYVNARQDRTAAINAHLRETKDLLDSIQGLDRNQARVAYLWMTEQPNLDTETALLEGLPDDSKAVLREMKLQVANIGKEAVELGLLTQEVYDRNNLSYLHRSYLKYEQEISPAVKAQRTAAAALRGNNLKMRGLRDDATMAQIDMPDPVKRVVGKADTSLKGKLFTRLEMRAQPTGTDALPGIPGESLGRLRKVVYVPAGAVPDKYKGWRVDGTWEARWFDKAGQVGMHRDFTMDEQRRMGVIDEVRFAYAKTMLNMIGDVETARFLDHVRQIESKLTAQQVADAGGVVIDKPSDRKSTVQTYKPNEWVKVPETSIPGTGIQKYGSLAGKFVPGAIWNDIRGTMNLQAQSKEGELWDGMMRIWKVAKTALSPAVHTNNIMSNFVLADLADVRGRDIARALGTLFRARAGNKAKNPAQYEAAKALLVRYQDSGAESGSMLHIDLKEDVMKPLLDELQRVEATAADDIGALANASQIMSLALHGHLLQAYQRAMMTKLGRGVKWAPERMRELYGKEDTVFRLASFIKSVEEGKTDREAGNLARKSFLDYEINAPWVQVARRFGLPFIAFTYRAAPLLINGFVKTPWKMAKYAAIGGGLNALFYAMIGAGGDEDKERRLLPDELQGTALGIFPRMIRMPWNDEFGSPVFLDVRRWIPGGDIVDAYQSQGAIALPSWLGMGGPLAMLMELGANKSMFTGRPLTNESDTMVEKIMKIMDYQYKFWTPNVPLPNPIGYIGEAMTDSAPSGWMQTYALTKMQKAVTGETDTLGRDVSIGQAAANIVGVKVGAYPEDQMIKRAQGRTRAGLEEIGKVQADIRRQVLKGGLSEEAALRKLEDQNQKRQDLQRKLGERLGQ